VYVQPALREWMYLESGRRGVTLSSYVRERFALARRQSQQQEATQ
jgi:hypothetical protein